MVGTSHGLFVGDGVSGAGQAAELALLSAAAQPWALVEAAGGRDSDPSTPWDQPGLLRVSADPRAAQAPRAVVQSQDGVAGHAWSGLVGDGSAVEGTGGATARRSGAGGRTEPAVGLGHHQHPGVEWSEGPLGHHDRLRGPDGPGVAFCSAHHGRGSGRDAAGGRVPAVRSGAGPRAGDRVPQRQWAGVHLASIPAVRAGDGADPLPHAPAEPGVERLGGSVLRQLQAGLRVPGVPRDVGNSGTPAPGVDRALQPARATQRLGDAVASRVLCGRSTNF